MIYIDRQIRSIQKEYYFFLKNEKDIKAILKEIDKVKLDKGL